MSATQREETRETPRDEESVQLWQEQRRYDRVTLEAAQIDRTRNKIKEMWQTME